MLHRREPDEIDNIEHSLSDINGINLGKTFPGTAKGSSVSYDMVSTKLTKGEIEKIIFVLSRLEKYNVSDNDPFSDDFQLDFEFAHTAFPMPGSLTPVPYLSISLRRFTAKDRTKIEKILNERSLIKTINQVSHHK